MKRMTRILQRLAALTALAVAWVSPASAYHFPTCNGRAETWGGPNWTTVGFRPVNVSFPAGSTARTALERVQTAWNSRTPGGTFRINFTFTDDSWMGNLDGINDVGFTSDYPWGGAL